MAAQKNGFHGCAIEDQYYGQRLIKIVQVEKNGERLWNLLSLQWNNWIDFFNAEGAIHTIKEYQMELHLSLADAKEFMSGKSLNLSWRKSISSLFVRLF